MKELLDEFKSIEAELAQEKGDLALFALFEREDIADRWDLVIAAPWIDEDKKPLLDDVARRLKGKLAVRDLVRLSRVVLLDPSEPFVQEMNRLVRVNHGLELVENVVFNGMTIARGYVITSEPKLSSSAGKRHHNRREATAPGRRQ